MPAGRRRSNFASGTPTLPWRSRPGCRWGNQRIHGWRIHHEIVAEDHVFPALFESESAPHAVGRAALEDSAMLSPSMRSVDGGAALDAGDEFARRLAAEIDRCRPRARRLAAPSAGAPAARESASAPLPHDDFSERLAARLRQANRDRLGARAAAAGSRVTPIAPPAEAAPAVSSPSDARSPADSHNKGNPPPALGALPRDLARVVAAWPRLTPQVRGAILSLVDRR